jgi:hypothetical protein
LRYRISTFFGPLVTNVVVKYDENTKGYLVVLERTGMYTNVVCFSSSDYKEAMEVLVITRLMFLERRNDSFIKESIPPIPLEPKEKIIL